MEIFNLLAKTKFDTYMPYIIAIVVILAVICLVNWFKAKKADEHYLEVTGLLKEGAKIKTLTGIYGTVKSVDVKENVRYVVIELVDGALMEIDARAIYGLDERTLPKEIQE